MQTVLLTGGVVYIVSNTFLVLLENNFVVYIVSNTFLVLLENNFIVLVYDSLR